MEDVTLVASVAGPVSNLQTEAYAVTLRSALDLQTLVKIQ